MAQTKSKLSEVLNEQGFDAGIVLGESTCKLPAGVTKVAIEGTSGNLIETANGLDRALLLVENSSAGEYEVEVAEGESPPSLRKGIGKYAFKCPSKTISAIPLESARHLDKNGNLVLTFSNSSFSGNIALLVLKKS